MEQHEMSKSNYKLITIMGSQKTEMGNRNFNQMKLSFLQEIVLSEIYIFLKLDLMQHTL